MRFASQAELLPILKKGAFTVSFADAVHVVEADFVGMVSANQVPDKLAKANLHTRKSEFVDTPVIDEFPMTLECKFLRATEDGNIVGQIVNISADEKILGEDGKIDPDKLQPISFEPVHNTYRKLGGSGRLRFPGWRQAEIKTGSRLRWNVRNILTLPSVNRAIWEYRTEVFAGSFSDMTCAGSPEYLERTCELTRWALE